MAEQLTLKSFAMSVTLRLFQADRWPLLFARVEFRWAPEFNTIGPRKHPPPLFVIKRADALLLTDSDRPT